MRVRQVIMAGLVVASASGCAWQQDPGLAGSRTVVGAASGAEAAARRAMTSQRPEGWRQDATNYGIVVPGPVVMREGRTCRRANITTVLDGKVYATEVCLLATGRAGEVGVEPLSGRP